MFDNKGSEQAETSQALKSLSLSAAQQRLWFLSLVDGKVNAVGMIIRRAEIHGKMNVIALQRALDTLYRRHSELRTRFVHEHGRPFLIVDDSKVTFPLQIVKAGQDFTPVFDVECGKVVSVQLSPRHQQCFELCLAMHHFVCDEWSMSLFMEDLGKLYDVYSHGKTTFMPLTVNSDQASCQQGVLLRGVNEQDMPRPPISSKTKALRVATEYHQTSLALDRTISLPPCCDIPLNIAFRKTGTQTPLFIVPEAGGEMLYGPRLTSMIDSDIPVYGLFPPDCRQSSRVKTLHKMAEHYVRRIRDVQPHGPYRLLGWSLGGTMAYEIAVQLMGEDEQIEFLGVLDCWGGGSISDHHQRKRTAVQGGVFRLHDPVNLLPGEWHEDYFYRWMLQRRDIMNADYLVRRLPLDIDVFVAEERFVHDDTFDPYLGWDQVLPRSSIDVTLMKGECWQLAIEPYAEMTGKAFSEAIHSRAVKFAAKPKHESYEPVVKLQLGQPEGALVFCIPGAGDNVFSFINLVQHLDTSMSIYGLQPRGLWGDEPPHSSVEAAACFYVKAMLPHLSGQAVHLVGHSFGGWVALELVNQLENRGIQVASLTMADSQVPVVQQREYTHVQALMKLVNLFEMQGTPLGLTAEMMERIQPVDRLPRLRESLIAHRVTPATLKLSHLDGIFRVFESNIRTGYSPARIPQTAVRLLVANESTAVQKQGWRTLIQTIHIEQSQGNHIRLLKGEYVRQLAELIQA